MRCGYDGKSLSDIQVVHQGPSFYLIRRVRRMIFNLCFESWSSEYIRDPNLWWNDERT